MFNDGFGGGGFGGGNYGGNDHYYPPVAPMYDDSFDDNYDARAGTSYGADVGIAFDVGADNAATGIALHAHELMAEWARIEEETAAELRAQAAAEEARLDAVVAEWEQLKAETAEMLRAEDAAYDAAVAAEKAAPDMANFAPAQSVSALESQATQHEVEPPWVRAIKEAVAAQERHMAIEAAEIAAAAAAESEAAASRGFFAKLGGIFGLAR